MKRGDVYHWEDDRLGIDTIVVVSDKVEFVGWQGDWVSSDLRRTPHSKWILLFNVEEIT